MITKEDGFTYFTSKGVSWKYKENHTERGLVYHAFQLTDGIWVDELCMIKPNGEQNGRQLNFLGFMRIYYEELEKKLNRNGSDLESTNELGEFIGSSSYRFDLDIRLLKAMTKPGVVKVRFINEAIKEKLIRDNLLTDQND